MWFGDDRDRKRTLGMRDKQILYRNADKRCENPTCRKKIDFDEMQVGHMKAWSKGGAILQHAATVAREYKVPLRLFRPRSPQR